MNTPEPLRALPLVALGVEHALAAVGEHVDASPDPCTARQVHGRRLVRVPPERAGAEADALVTSLPGQAVGVYTADCVPILLVDEALRAVAAVHAGWRGTAQRVVAVGVAGLQREAGVAASSLWAVIGPHIGACCYEVDEPVRHQFGDTSAFAPSDRRPGHWQLDLLGANRSQLIEAGVDRDRILHVGTCTCCGDRRLPSHRRDAGTGRMLHWVRLPVRAG